MSAIGLRAAHPVILLGGAAVLLALTFGLVWLHLPPGLVLGAILAAAGLGLVWLHPYVGLHVFIAMLYVENSVPTEEGVTAMKAIGVVILLGWLMSIATHRQPGVRFDGFTLAVLLFLAWCGLSPVFALDPSVAVGRLFSFVQLGAAALMFGSVADTPERLKRVYWSIVGWTWVATILGIVQYYFGMAASTAGLVRNKNLMATYIDIAIVCAYLLYGMTRARGARLFLACSLPVFFLGVGLSFSRAGFVALGFAMLLIWYFAARLRSFLMLFGSAAILLTITFVLPESFWQRAASIVPAIRNQQDTFGARVGFWKVGVAMVQDKPLTGVGAGNFHVAFLRYAASDEIRFSEFAAHNAYVGMAAETGLVGLGLYLLLHLQALRQARRTALWGLMNDRLDFHLIGVAAVVSILSMMIGALSGDAQTLKMLWIWLGLAAGIGSLVPADGDRVRPVVEERGEGRVPEGAGAWRALP